MEFENENSGVGSLEGKITPLQDVTSSLVGEEMEIVMKKMDLISVLLEFRPNVLKRTKKGKTPLQVLSQSISDICATYPEVSQKQRNKFEFVKKSLHQLTERQTKVAKESGSSNTNNSSSVKGLIQPGENLFSRSPQKITPENDEALEVIDYY